jgi:hypothetical protein
VPWILVGVGDGAVESKGVVVEEMVVEEKAMRRLIYHKFANRG